MHLTYDLSGGVDDFELTDNSGAERLSRFEWQRGDIALGDRYYARPGELPAVLDSGADLLIRTGGELRVSNFLLWEVAYAEMWATPVLWPDFSVSDLDDALGSYAKRERRFGR